ncbi:MAG: hypothetical protein KAY54_03210 [Burkholderiaceae bacterium]|nr:hypothetical protein [Burkholderiaceae bacterium]
MKLLIVAGDHVIFHRLAQELAAGIGDAHELTLATEAVHLSPRVIWRQRVQRSGFWRALDQLVFKVFDMLWLRRREETDARQRLDAARPLQRIPALNSPQGLEWLRQGRFDVVIGLATSIIAAQALALPRHGFINIHPGVLPAYRGTGNLWPVLRHDWKQVGCTVHWMTSEIDVGRILALVRLSSWPDGLWALHVAALRAGCAALADIVQRGNLLHAQLDVTGETSAYYGWYGFMDYLRFRRAQAQRPR